MTREFLLRHVSESEGNPLEAWRKMNGSQLVSREALQIV
jgi:hypothetical protein